MISADPGEPTVQGRREDWRARSSAEGEGQACCEARVAATDSLFWRFVALCDQLAAMRAVSFSGLCRNCSVNFGSHDTQTRQAGGRRVTIQTCAVAKLLHKGFITEPPELNAVPITYKRRGRLNSSDARRPW